MNFKFPVAIAATVLGLQASSISRADRRDEARHEERHEAQRAAPPRFEPHPGGIHPHGPMVRQHPTRVMGAKVVRYGAHQWRHWEHPEFSRPAYYWEWNAIHSVSCVAEDSYGDQYPVTESTFAGFGLANMTQVEDDALDRCNQESGGDPSCYLATCTHF